MEQQIKLLIPLFLEGTSYPSGSVLNCDSEQAKRIVALGQAEYVVPHHRDSHSATKTTTTTSTPAPAAEQGDPHQQPFQSAVAMPPTERATTRTTPSDPKTHHKK